MGIKKRNILDKLKIRTKLIVSFSIVVVISAFIGIFSMQRLKNIEKSYESLYNQATKPMGSLIIIASDLQQLRVTVRDMILAETPQLYEANKKLVLTLGNTFDEEIADFELTLFDENGRMFTNMLKQAKENYMNYLPRFQQFVESKNIKEARMLMTGEWAETNKEIQNALSELVNYNVDSALKISEKNKELATATYRIQVIILILSALVSLLLGLIIAANIQKTIKSVIGQTKKLVTSALRGEFTARANTGQTNEEFRDIAQGINDTLDVVVEKIYWYEQMLDSIPFPISVTDMEMNWTFFNKAAEQVTGKSRKAMCGKQCNNWGADICKTERCGIEMMKKGIFSSTFRQPGMEMDFQVDTTYLLDATGKRIGHIEVVQDVTKVIRVSEFNKEEVRKLAANLVCLSKGDINFDTKVSSPDKYTEEEYRNFTLISQNLSKVQAAVNLLITDANALASAGVEGQLTIRTDAAKHQGDFRKIVEGFNAALDAVIGPLNATARYIERISLGDLPPVISDTYNGDFNTLKVNLNVLIRSNNDIIEKTRLVASGDLTVNLRKRSETDELMQSLDDMVKSTANIISEFKAASGNISASSQQMSSTSQEMSQGASEQASSAEEASSSMEEMAANIQQNTENARQTEKIAMNAAEGISKVSAGSEQTLRYMQDIADKVSIIGEIARQTNILALNAAVEAARAGEHGKGFAVVAAEVRKLAERSQVSAIEIDTLTKNSVRATEESVKLLASLAPEISQTAKLVQEIAAASMEQNSGADQVNNAIQQLNQVTQQNAAASEEMATSSEELASQAQQLLDMIAYFKLNNDSTVKNSAGIVEKEQNISMTSGYNTHAQKPAMHSEHPSKKGVVINMGKDNLDSGYEKF